jgi:hypothetical protein
MRADERYLDESSKTCAEIGFDWPKLSGLE